MTRQEFIRSKNRFGYGIVLPEMILLAVMIVLPFAWFGIQDTHRDLPLIKKIAGDAVCVGVLVFGLWFTYVHNTGVMRRLQYRCPHCQNGFGGYENEVLETSKCHYCGFQVIDATEQHIPPEAAGG